MVLYRMFAWLYTPYFIHSFSKTFQILTNLYISKIATPCFISITSRHNLKIFHFKFKKKAKHNPMDWIHLFKTQLSYFGISIYTLKNWSCTKQFWQTDWSASVRSSSRFFWLNTKRVNSFGIVINCFRTSPTSRALTLPTVSDSPTEKVNGCFKPLWVIGSSMEMASRPFCYSVTKVKNKMKTETKINFLIFRSLVT